MKRKAEAQLCSDNAKRRRRKAILAYQAKRRRKEEAVAADLAKRSRKGEAVLQDLRMSNIWKRKKFFGFFPWRRKKTPGVLFLPDTPHLIRWGRRSRNDAITWKCKQCGHSNKPSKHVFVNLPAFTCQKKSCNLCKHIDYKFSFGNLAVNDVSPIGRIKDQGDTDYCVAFAFAMACEIAVRIRALLAGNTGMFPRLCPYYLLAGIDEMRRPGNMKLPSFTSYHTVKQYIMSLDSGEIPDYGNSDATANLLMDKGMFDKRHNRWYKVGVDRVDNTFESISSNLAKGCPLIATIVPGKKFKSLKYGVIYKAPINAKDNIDEDTLKSLVAHAVVLIGARRRKKKGEYLYFVNSYGKQFCMRMKDGQDYGGIGKLQAGDTIMKPYRLLRCALDE